ncbi:MAG: 30S ribosomal protein THX [Bacteroidota bacterium]
MGKGDKKSRKGKIIMGSYGKTRKRRPTKKAKPAKEKK